MYAARVKTLFAWVLSCTALAFPQRAHADSASSTVRVALHWKGGGSCLRPELVQGGVETQLGHPVFVSDKAISDVTLSVDVSDADTALQVDLELQRRGESLGNRSLRGSSEGCAKLLDAVIVVVALLVDVPPPKEESAVRSPAATAPPAAAALPAPPVTPARRASTNAVLSARALAVSGLLPGAAAGFGFDVRAAFAVAPWLGWRVGGDYLPRDRMAAQGGVVAFSAFAGQVGFSPLHFETRSSFRLVPWLLVSAPALAAQGQGFAANHSGYRWLPVVSVSASAEWRLSRQLWLTAEPALGLALARPRMLYDDPAAGQREIFRPSKLLFSAALGLAWRFL